MKPFQKVAVHGFIKKDGKFLVTLRSSINDYKPNMWDFPGGTIEIGETPEQALTREINEETNLKVEIIKPIFIHSDFQNGERHQFWIVYECNYISGEVKLNPEEHNEYKWVNNGEVLGFKKILFVEKFFENNTKR